MLCQGAFYREYGCGISVGLCLAYVHVDGAFVLLMYMLVCQCLAHWEDYEVAKGAQLLFLCQCSMHLTFGNYLLLTSGG